MSRRHQHKKDRPLSAEVFLVLFAISCYHVSGLQIPKDVEILDGYEFDDSPEYYPTDATSDEARSLLLGLQKSIRNKRSSMAYDLAKQSLASSVTTAFSDPPPSSSDSKQQQQHSAVEVSNSRAEQRSMNSVSSQHIEVSEAQRRMDVDTDHGRALEDVPKAEQQVMDPDYDYYSQRRISTWRGDAYSTAPSDGDPIKSASNDDGDDDTQAEATNNFMSRGRQARVNFVTQPKKESGSNKDVPEPVVVAKVPLLNAAFYETKYGLALPSYNYNYEMYPSRSYDPYLRRYDRFDEQYPRFDPYSFEDQYLYRRHYDPYDSYSPRIPQYPEPYYNYPDRHYDIPEPRDYTSSLYNNEVYDKAAAYPESKYSPTVYPSSKYPDYPLNPSSKYPNYPLTPSIKYPEYPLNPVKYPEYPLNPSSKYPDYPLNPSSKYPDYPLNAPSSKYPDFPRNQRRFVYYAHLPEIVRTPYDFPFRYNRDRHDGTLSSNNGVSSVHKPDKTNGNSQSTGSGGAAGIGSGVGGNGVAGLSGGSPTGVDRLYDYTKRDKKDHVTPKPNKLNATSRQ